MLRSAASKVMWVGRATVFLVGLAVILALSIGLASSTLAHTEVDNKLFHLGHSNLAKKPTKLVSRLAVAAKSTLIVKNRGGGPALDLRVGNTTTPANDVAPMKVNSTKAVTNLNADQLDGNSEEDFYAAGSKVADSSHADEADDAAKLGGVAASDYVQTNDPRLASPPITFNVASNSSIAWLIGNASDYVSGSNVNPTLTLTRGMTYRFNVTVSGHPFRIASSSSGPAFNVGVTNNDVMNGTLTFKVPMDAPNTLYYYCLAHPNMNGVINIR